MAVSGEHGRPGAYGLWFGTGVSGGAAWLVEAPPDWPRIDIEPLVGTPPEASDRVTDDDAVFNFASGGALHIDRLGGRAQFTFPEALTDAELVHPYLAPVGAVFARWLGREAFHAGAFIAGGRAFALIGAKGAGKSSMLASLSMMSHEIVCDDMLVIEDGGALAGPRCIDLREPAAAHLGIGEVTLRPPEPRWRVPLGAVPTRVPLAGWVFLEWGDAVSADRVSLSDRLPLLATNRSLVMTTRNPVALLDLAALPMWVLRMPQDWAELPRASEHLLELTARV